MKTLHIKTYGCQMNVYDSSRMMDLLQPYGYAPGEEETEADMVILNTCHIREKAAEKLYSELGRLRLVKEARARQGKSTIIAVAGCVAQAEGKEVLSRAPFVDIVVGPQSYQTLPDLLARVKRDHAPAVMIDFPSIQKFDQLPEEIHSAQASAFLSIQEGCDKFCTFCVVPYTRGAEYSRPISDIYREALRLVSHGAKELVLLGQNVNAFHGKTDDGSEWDLGTLITHLAKINGVERLRYTTSHPNDMHESLYRAHKEEEKLMPFLHLPVQAGADRILQQMNRKHRRDDYLRVIEKLRAARSDLEFSSDFIVGFPGETDQEFEDTLALVREVQFAQAYSFKYSPRPGTPAAERENQVPEEVKSERLQRLQEELNTQQERFNKTAVGTIVPVLFDRIGKREGQLLGKTPHLQSVHIEAPHTLYGTIQNIKIESATPRSLSGTIS